VRQIVLLSLLLLFASAAIAQQPAAGFSTTGEWRFSNLPGPVAQKSTLWSSDGNATATWNPQIRSVGPIRISFYVVGYSANVTAARIEIVHAGKKEEQVVDMSQSGSRWITLGTYDFSGTAPEYVRLMHGPGPGNVRAAALRMEILDSKNPNLVWQDLLLDDLLPVNPATLQPKSVQFRDMSGSSAAADVGYLAATGVLPGVGASQFAPEQSLSPAELRTALNRLAQQAQLTLASTTLNQLKGQSSFTGNQLLAILEEAAKSSGKNLDWLHVSANSVQNIAIALGLTFNTDTEFNADASVSRAEAAVLLRRFERAIVEAGPPATAHWRLAFDDEFNGNSVDWSVWLSAHGELRSLSSRWPENAVVSGGQLHLVTRKERRGEAQWTAASIWTKAFQQKYGYWEARYRYAKAPGLNNAFWMIHNNTSNDGFEIDVNEGHYPNEVNATLHQSGMPDDSTRYSASDDLSRDFHVYGCKWDQQQIIIYYMDGKEIARKPNTKANLPVPAMLSTAVLPWAGAPSDALNGTSMDVDWVRVYTPAP
jgi:beta-glucanase (GH16 family)